MKIFCSYEAKRPLWQWRLELAVVGLAKHTQGGRTTVLAGRLDQSNNSVDEHAKGLQLARPTHVRSE
jgi:hypothetical protein